MGDVIDIEEAMPHFVFQVDNGNAHVLPVALVEDWATGRQEIPTDEDTQAVIRAILAEWLEG